MQTYDFGIASLEGVIENINNSPVQGFKELTAEFKAASYALDALREADESAPVNEEGIEAHLEILTDNGALFDSSQAAMIAIAGGNNLQITYYAADVNMGDTPAKECDQFRVWAKQQLESEFPGHDITVSEDNSLNTCNTDDIDNEEQIADFCSRLWDRCPWDFE